MAKNFGPRRDGVPRGMKVNPYCMLAYTALARALQSNLNSVALRILLFAILADRGNHRERLCLGLTRVCTGVECSRNSAVAGLRSLVACGLLIKLDGQGHYRLGAVFDKYIPIDTGSAESADDLAEQDSQGLDADEQGVDEPGDEKQGDARQESEGPGGGEPAAGAPAAESYADAMHAIWNELADENGMEPTLDAEGRRRAEKWAEKRIKAGKDPVADFKMTLELFLERGHTVPLGDGEERNPRAYSFNGFMNVCQMFLRRVPTKQRREMEKTEDGAHQHDGESAVAESVAAITADSLMPENISDIPEVDASFVTGTTPDGRFIYKKEAIESVEELARVFEHAFDLSGHCVKVLGVPKAMKKCAEDFEGILACADAKTVVLLVGAAKKMSELEQQRAWFSKHPFGFSTAHTLFEDAMGRIAEESVFADACNAAYGWQHDPREALQTHSKRILRDLSRIADDLAMFGAGGVREERIAGCARSIGLLEHDYGCLTAGSLSTDIVDGLWCLATLGVINIPEKLSNAVGEKPEQPDFDWAKCHCDATTGEKLRNMWLASRPGAGVDTAPATPSSALPESDGGAHDPHETVSGNDGATPSAFWPSPAEVAPQSISPSVEPAQSPQQGYAPEYQVAIGTTQFGGTSIPYPAHSGTAQPAGADGGAHIQYSTACGNVGATHDAPCLNPMTAVMSPISPRIESPQPPQQHYVQHPQFPASPAPSGDTYAPYSANPNAIQPGGAGGEHVQHGSAWGRGYYTPTPDASWQHPATVAPQPVSPRVAPPQSTQQGYAPVYPFHGHPAPFGEPRSYGNPDARIVTAS